MAGKLIFVTTLVDTTSILANPSVPSSQVVFMTDNNAGNGSTREGTNELNTACTPGDVIIWKAVAINGTDQIVISGFENSSGDVFGFNIPQPTNPAGPTLMGTVTQQGNETYQLQININGKALFSWDPFLTSSAATELAFAGVKAHAARR